MGLFPTLAMCILKFGSTNYFFPECPWVKPTYCRIQGPRHREDLYATCYDVFDNVVWRGRVYQVKTTI